MTAKRTAQSVTVTIDRELVSRTRNTGLSMSAILTVALNAELRKRAAIRWHEENAEVIAALNQLADETGCFSNEYRSFQRYNLRYTAVVAGASRFPLLSMLPATLLVRLIAVLLFHQHLFERSSHTCPPERSNPILLPADSKEYVFMTHKTAAVSVNVLGMKSCDASVRQTLIKGTLDSILGGI